MPITRLVKMTVTPGTEQAFLKTFESARDRIRNFEGCNHLEIWNDIHNPSVFFTYSIWDSEDHLEKYRQSELFAFVWKNVKPLFSADAEAWSMNKI